ncbi:MAG: hypothetical protein KGS45_06955 [Planctomycetes bacterium]|nr:hypothetical protein [Planctomycetota bacterium]
MPQTESNRVPGRALFVAGTWVLVLFSTIHMIPMFADLFGTPTQPLEIEAKRAMAAVTVDMGPFHTHWGKLNKLLSVSYSALLYFVAAVNFVTVGAAAAHGKMKSLALVNAIFAAVLLAICLAFSFPPPAVFALLAMVLFGLAAMKTR